MAIQHVKNSRVQSRGFTLIEMIVVIALVSVIGAVAASRVMRKNAFNGLIVRDQIISLTRAAQHNSLGRDAVSLTFTPDAADDTLTIVTRDSSGTINSATTSMQSLSLTGDINETASCDTVNGASPVSLASPLVLNFGRLGNLGISGVQGATGAVSSAVRICINNDPNYSVCVSSGGYAYRGNCDD